MSEERKRESVWSRALLGPPKTKYNSGSIIVRRYRGHQTRATADFQRDAQNLVAKGYYPVNEVWAPGSWGCGAFLIALLLCFVLIGFVVFIYMVIVKPDGTLTVTYEYMPQQPVADEKACPRCAERVKAAALVCRFCGNEFQQSTPVKT